MCQFDTVLLAPSWYRLQKLLNVTENAAAAVDMSYNTNKTARVIASPYDRRKIVSVFSLVEIGKL